MARQILVASIGMAPQVVTETLWALLNPSKLIDPQHRTRARFAPSSIHLVRTSRSREVLVARGLEGKLTELLNSHGEPAATLIVDIPRDASSGEIADIRTEAENIAYANHIGRVIQHYAADRDTRPSAHTEDGTSRTRKPRPTAGFRFTVSVGAVHRGRLRRHGAGGPGGSSGP